jgi:hypothetical protein
MMWPLVWAVSLIIAAVAAFALTPKGWRTVALNTVVGVLVASGPFLQYLAGVGWDDYLDKETAFLLVIALNILNILARVKTTTPIGVK